MRSASHVNGELAILCNEHDSVGPGAQEQLADYGSPLPSEADLDFDEDDRQRGHRLRRAVSLTVARAIFEIGAELSAAHRKFTLAKQARGRNSLYGKWLQHYLPAFERKTLDRWRIAFEAFAPLLKEEIRTECLDFVDRMQTSAIYALSSPQVADEQRRLAIRLAQGGEIINMAWLEQMQNSSRTPFCRHIVLPGGSVVISINHDDFRQALQEALWELKRKP